MHIVYIEDNPANVALVERISKMTGDTLTTYVDPKVALGAVSASNPDLILMDVNLGDTDINGLQLTKLLREEGVTVPIVVVTAYDAMGYPDEFQTAGFNEYVLKPVSISSMIDLINAYRHD